MVIDERSGTGRLEMGVTLLVTPISMFTRQNLQRQACWLDGCQVTLTREGEQRWQQSFRQHVLHRWGRRGQREWQSEPPGLGLRNKFGEFRQHRSDRLVDRGGNPLFDPGLFLADALAIGGHQQGPIPQQRSEPGCGIRALHGRESEGLEPLKPIQTPAVHAALKPHQALMATTMTHCFKQQCLGIRAGTMGRWS
jgi:hypothetical protein